MQTPIDALWARIPRDQQEMLNRKNELLNVLGNDAGAQAVALGDTSSGKSTTLNFLFGFPINKESDGICTRRPCVMTMKPNTDADTLKAHVTFSKNGSLDVIFTDLHPSRRFCCRRQRCKKTPRVVPLPQGRVWG